MKLSELFRRQNDTDSAFGELETNLSDVVMFNLVPPLVPEADELSQQRPQEAGPKEEPGAEVQVQSGGEPEPEPQDAEEASSEPRTTPTTQARLAEFTAFEAMQHVAQRDLDVITSTLAKVKGAQHQAREFLNSVHSGIYRSNELELTVAKLGAENRKLMRQAEHVVRMRSQLESLTVAFKRREASLLETAEGLRTSLSTARLDLVEIRSQVVRLETERQEVMNALANAASHSERTARENEILREKNINLATDLDTVARKRTEAERKLDEYVAMHERDTAEAAELRSKLASAEAERQRVQKQNDALQARIIEASEAMATLENELEEQAKRHEVGLQGLKDERETLLARLEISTRAEHDASQEIAELTARLNEATDAERLLAERLAALTPQAETVSEPE